VITLLLLALNLAVYSTETPTTCTRFGLVPAHPTAEAFVTSLFLHDPANIRHLVLNMACLVLFGVAVERVVGPLRFVALYLAAGIVGGFFHILCDPAATDALVGASGAIMGLMPIAAVVWPRTLGFVASYTLYNIAWLLLGAGGSVSVAAHVGGFVAGAAFVAVARFSNTLQPAT
jgi:membrane associated rhomboid family serine protease